MTIQFKDSKNEKVEELKNAYYEAVRNEDADEEEVFAKQNEYLTAYFDMNKDQTIKEAREQAMNAHNDEEVKMKRGLNVLTSEEKRFFKALTEDELNSFKKEELLPETVVYRIFEDIKATRPLLSKLNFELTGINTRIITGEPEGSAVWGEIFGKIQGLIGSTFKEVSFSQNKLTAFSIIPKDLLKYGYEWVERYVRGNLVEAFAVQLERGFVLGAGAAQNQPIGLMKDYDADAGTVTDKVATGTLTFDDAKTTAIQLAHVVNALSVKENGKRVSVNGKVTLVVNPAEEMLIQSQYTIQNVNGVWVTSLPYNLTVVSSEFVPEGKLIAFVNDRYTVAYSGDVAIKSYDQTLALEDADVYIAKQFAHGFPADNKAALVYDVTVPGFDTTTPEV